MTPELRTTLLELLDVADNLERAVLAVDPNAGSDPVADGVKQIHRQVANILKRYEIRSFTSVGGAFDPHRHEAVGRQASAVAPKNQVLEVLKQGYLKGHELFRPAQVIVSEGPSVPAPAPTAAASAASPPLTGEQARLSGSSGEDAAAIAARRRASAAARRAGGAASGSAPATRRAAPTTGAPRVAAQPPQPAPTPSNARPARAERARSGVTIPDWVTNHPTSDERTIHLVGRISAARDVQRGRARAVEQALPWLLDGVPAMLEPGPLQNAYVNLKAHLQQRKLDGVWERITTEIPSAERWVADFYWHQVESDVHGKAYDVAVLLSIPTSTIREVLAAHGEERRAANIIFIDQGPFVRSIVQSTAGESAGVLVTDVSPGLIAKAGLLPGDIITHCNRRETPDPETARRLLNLSSRGRRPFDIRYLREYRQEASARVDPMQGKRR